MYRNVLLGVLYRRKCTYCIMDEETVFGSWALFPKKQDVKPEINNYVYDLI
jgi:hypothetical protein